MCSKLLITYALSNINHWNVNIAHIWESAAMTTRWSNLSKMWKIVKVINKTDPEQQVLLSGGGHFLNVAFGPVGSSYRLIVTNKGFLDLVDIGKGKSGWGIDINGSRFRYNEGEEGQVSLLFNNDGIFEASGNGNKLKGYLKKLPAISPIDTYLLDQMMSIKMVPYQNIPDAPGKSDSEIEKSGKDYFPFTEYSKLLSYSVYDWTTQSFMRLLILRFFAYTGIEDNPLNLPTIANLIWTFDSPPFIPQDKDYMHSFLMEPSNSESDVLSQLTQNHKQLRAYCEAQNNLLRAAFYSLPRTSVKDAPVLYSGQPDVFNISLDQFSAQFCESSFNNGPVGTPMIMPFNEALETIFKVGRTLTLKAVMSFTKYRDYAMKYSRGILLIVNPPHGAIKWENANYITPLSDDPKKDEYTFLPGCKFVVTKVELDDNKYWLFTMTASEQ